MKRKSEVMGGDVVFSFGWFVYVFVRARTCYLPFCC